MSEKTYTVTASALVRAQQIGVSTPGREWDGNGAQVRAASLLQLAEELMPKPKVEPEKRK